MGRRFKNFRARLFGQLPATRRRFALFRAEADARLTELQHQYSLLDRKINLLNGRADALSNFLLALPGVSTSAACLLRIPFDLRGVGEVCLFVTHAAEPVLKPHVRDHLAALAREGVQPVLIVNSTLPFEDFRLDDSTATLLKGCLIRANVGFDFAAWAHAYSLLQLDPELKRIYLVNDSVVGPLADAPFVSMLARIRSMTADFIGLTANRDPQLHLQSYFLVCNQRLLHSSTFDRLMRGIVNLPTKEDVIAQYETQITRYLSSLGFVCSPVFPAISVDPSQTDDTVHSWAPLIAQGFPFIKSRVLNELRNLPDAMRLIPKRYLTLADK